MKVYSTKYCLTKGIELIEGEYHEDYQMIVYKRVGIHADHLHGEGKDWHRTLEAAQEKAEEVRIKRLHSLDNQIKRINAIDFNKVTELQ